MYILGKGKKWKGEGGIPMYKVNHKKNGQTYTRCSSFTIIFYASETESEREGGGGQTDRQTSKQKLRQTANRKKEMDRP